MSVAVPIRSMDGTVVCAECGESTSATQELCPVCGAELPSEPDEGGSSTGADHSSTGAERSGTDDPSTGAERSGAGPAERSSGSDSDRPDAGEPSAGASSAGTSPTDAAPTDAGSTGSADSDRRSDAIDSTSGGTSSQAASSQAASSQAASSTDSDGSGSTAGNLSAAVSFGLLGAGLIALPIFLLSGRPRVRTPIRIAIALQTGGGLLLFLAASARLSGYAARTARRPASFGLTVGILGTVLIFLSM